MTYDPRLVDAATVYVDATAAATLTRTPIGTEFRYRDDYSGRPVATTLVLDGGPVISPAGAVPPFFAGLLPEGRRLSALRRSIKTSADDELSLLLPVGADLVGNISLFPEGKERKTVTPAVDMSARELDFSHVLTEAGIPDPVSLAGVQDKASARTIAIPTSAGGGASDAILKISPPEYPMLVENEAESLACARIMAARLRLPVARAEVVRDVHGRSGLLVGRFDRERGARYPVEDAAQIMGIYPADKYSVDFEELTLAVAGVCRSPLLALRSLAAQLAFAWLTGNGDLHAKNISVVDRGKGFEVAPIYDIPTTAPYGDHSLALPVAGSSVGLSKKKFLSYCMEVGLPAPVGEAVAQKAVSATENYAERIIAACSFDPRRARDLTRILRSRRRAWE
ncbi:HipA domain-containing protein [Corynebacterium sp. zg-331]|uniref:type II toxin-antitoxin system HipA family toxin n=1 Tax=unclassified Corynebacterium TaxID=2624378 RepID=UPI00128D0EEB|nr:MULTISPECIES: HipA domain-containing protein [unclassified Corynebacterium]MBC3185527.1 HipA domain-containing protein [Corynebacterium sp. zg-331]MPV52021.1 type II toxin-antitoxin system HipA family toxin [Corynebacterium sp. zg331]